MIFILLVVLFLFINDVVFILKMIDFVVFLDVLFFFW